MKKRPKEVAEPNSLKLLIYAFNALEQVYEKFVSIVNLRHVKNTTRLHFFLV